MTLLGQFSLWAALLVGLWCAAVGLSGGWKQRPEIAAERGAGGDPGEHHRPANIGVNSHYDPAHEHL